MRKKTDDELLAQAEAEKVAIKIEQKYGEQEQTGGISS